MTLSYEQWSLTTTHAGCICIALSDPLTMFHVLQVETEIASDPKHKI